MVRLSVNINKVALLRNARGGSLPDLLQVAKDCEAFGAEGITVHPRSDQRHIRYTDISALRAVVTTEFNIEGYPSPEFLALVLDNPPHQCTLVPDSDNQLTSDHGWDTVGQAGFLRDILAALREKNIRTALFTDPNPRMVAGAKAAGADRVELYTGPFAHGFSQDPVLAVGPYTEAALEARAIGVGVNAGHDLNLDNLRYFQEHCPGLLEVSIGHALICDALYYGLANVIRMYRQQLGRG
ncbi:MAG: pyridoxine 5'-phosphate synthase [Saprospiraceae bacterium]